MKILITDKMADEALAVLKKAGHKITYEEMDHDTLLACIAEYDALMVRGRTKVVAEIVRKGGKGNLKVIGRAGIGVDNIDIKAATQANIKVVNSPTGATSSVAELAIAHMLMLSRHLARADTSMKKGEWAKKQLKGYEISGKTLGLIGTGNIGVLTGKLAQSFGMKIIGYDPFVSVEDMEKQGITKIEQLELLMAQSDYISLHLPHIPQTHYIVNKTMISKMKPTAFLINCARGGTVDDKALYIALKNKKIAGAGLDVYETEPPKNNPLLTLDNVVLTPHIGANTYEGQIRAGTVCAEQINKILTGKTPDYWINKPK
jgi:D-3-phosphoglycerate dehydrogenase